jgi:prophage antirepressor-like protein
MTKTQMTEVQTFRSPEFGQVRTTTYNGEIAFVAKDVAERLGYTWSGTQRIEHVPEEWRGVTSVVTPSGVQKMAVLTEQGLYFFLARSDKPLALPFQKWIAGEVVPSIRKKGSYGVPRTKMALVQEALEYLIAENAANAEMLEAQQTKIKEDAPRVAFAKAFERQNVLCHLQRLANVLFNNGVRIGRNTLIGDFRQKGYIEQHNALLTQRALERGIGQNVRTGQYEYRGVTVPSFRAFLNYKGVCEVFSLYRLTEEQKEMAMESLAEEESDLFEEEGY